MYKIGDTQVPFRGVNDRTDGFDNMVGTFKTLTNMYASKDKQSLKSRNGFSQDVPTPTTLTMNTTSFEVTSKAASGSQISMGLTLEEILHVNWFKVKYPSDKLIRIAVAVYSYTVSGTTYYIMRTLMYPYWDGSTFQNYWKDITPYYIDHNAIVTEDGEELYDDPGTNMTSVQYMDMGGNKPCLNDLCGAYIYCNQKGFSSFNDGQYAESDKIIYNAANAVTAFEDWYLLSVMTENAASHNGTALWNVSSTTNQFELRVHKNLETGKIPYKHLVSATKASLTAYTVTSDQIGDKIIISYHTDGTKPSYTLQLDYVDKTFFNTGKVWSVWDLAKDTDADSRVNKFYDSRLTYGFPGYDSVMKSSIVGKTVTRYAASGGSNPEIIQKSSGSIGYYVSGFRAYDASRAYMATSYSVHSVWESLDGGVTWNTGYGYEDFPAQVNDIVYDGTSIWTVLDNGMVYENTGVSNSAITTPLRAITAVSTSIIVAVGNVGVIRRTTDGGTTWATRVSGTTKHIVDVKYAGGTTIYAITDTEILKSADSGDTWTIQSKTGVSFGKLSVVDATNAFISSTDGVWKTTNGTDWTRVNTTGADYVAAYNANSVAIIGDDGGNYALFVSQDGGASFTVKKRFITNNTTGVYLRGGGVQLWFVDEGWDGNKVFYQMNYSGGVTTSQSIPSAGSGESDTITAYDKVSGKITLSDNLGLTGFVNDVLYHINSVDVSIVVDNFVLSEIDVHGRTMAYKTFGQRDNQNNLKTTYETNFIKPIYDQNNLTHYNTIVATEGYCAVSISPETDFADGDTFFVYALGLHEFYRAGLHYDKSDVYTIRSGGYEVPYIMIHVPVGFNRTLTTAQIGMKLADTDETEDYLQAKLVINDDLEDASYDFRTTLAIPSGARRIQNQNSFMAYGYTKEFRMDKSKYDNTNLGGNHLQLTANPMYSSGDDPSYAMGDLYGYESVMNKDISWGAKNISVLRGRIFASDLSLNMLQFGEVLGNKVKGTTQTLFSLISSYGGNYHLFNDGSAYILTEDIGKIVATTFISVAQDVSIQENRNSLLVLGERGYLFYDMKSGTPETWIPSKYNGDCCIARKSVVSYGGYAFYAGMNGVYVFNGQKQQNILSLGASSLQNTWAAVPSANKVNAIGVFNQDDNQYWLIYYSLSGFTWRAIVFDFGDYLFDTEKSDLFTFNGRAEYDISTNGSAKYIDGNLYLVYREVKEDTIIYIAKYDKTIYSDLGSGALVQELQTNNLTLSDKYSILKNVSIDKLFTESTTLATIIDNTQRSSVTVASSVNRIEWKIPPNNIAIGRRIAVKMNQTQNNNSVYDINLKIDTDIHQRRLIKNNG